MYAIKPGRKAYLVGSTVGSLVTGIGMRWRETVVEVIEKNQNPLYELDLTRRVVLPEAAVALLTDVGVTEHILRRQLRPAKAWRFVTKDLQPLREGMQYPGCAPSEPVYHIAEGRLLRLLRSEYSRFGGAISWGTEALDPYEATDGSGKWFMRKEYGPATDAETIISYSNSNLHFKREVFAEQPDAIVVLFDVTTGLCDKPSGDILALFGTDFDVVMALGASTALHMWVIGGPTTPSRVAWKLIGKGRSDIAALTDQLHPVLKLLMENSTHRRTRPLYIPATTPSFRDDMQHIRISVMGDAMLPVDPFEWRGDRALTEIQESSALIRAFYSEKFSRGNVAEQLRNIEQDSLARRATLLKRDLHDAEHFLSVRPELEEDTESGPRLKRVGV